MNKLLFLFLLIPLIAFADSAGLSWVPPTEREDGTILTSAEIGGYRIYDISGAKIGNDIPPDATAFSVPISMMGQEIQMTCFDTEGRESSFSPSVVVPSNTMNPKSPTVTVTFTIGTPPGLDP